MKKTPHKLAPDILDFLEGEVADRGYRKVAADLETLPTTLEDALAVGVQRMTRDRLEEAAREMMRERGLVPSEREPEPDAPRKVREEGLSLQRHRNDLDDVDGVRRGQVWELQMPCRKSFRLTVTALVRDPSGGVRVFGKTPSQKVRTFHTRSISTKRTLVRDVEPTARAS